ASLLRAVVMSTLAAIARLRQVPVSGAEILARSVMLVVLCAPRLLGDVGFQLSAVATAGVLLAAGERITGWLVGVPSTGSSLVRFAWSRGARIGTWIAPALWTPLLAQLFCAPILAHTFGRVPFGALVITLAVVPAATLTMTSALIALVC